MELKLGKLEPLIDERTIPLRKILRVALLPELPSSWDCHEIRDTEGNHLFTIQDDFVFRNAGEDALGDCVKASRAHQTLVFEGFEQGKQIEITDQEVVDEYFKETGGHDIGLVLLTSLKDWRNKGWTVGNRLYTIYAFASVDWHDHDQVKHSIHLLNGVNFGMIVFQTDLDQFNAGEGWHLTGNNGYFQGRHGVYACQYRDTDNKPATWVGTAICYSENGLWCMTWGRKQFMTWDFWDARVDEAYAIVDNKNKWQGDSPLDVEKLDGYLEEITGQEEDEPDNPGCNFPFIGKLIQKVKR
jgi:hypothetical protein